MHSVVNQSFACQPTLLSVVSPVLGTDGSLTKLDDKELFFELLALDAQDLRVLHHIGSSSGITAKDLGLKINLSRYAALKRAQNLVKKDFATFDTVASTKTGIRATYIFRLAENITSELIGEALVSKADSEGYLKQEANVTASAQEAISTAGAQEAIFTADAQETTVNKTSVEGEESKELKEKLRYLNRTALEFLELISTRTYCTEESLEKELPQFIRSGLCSYNRYPKINFKIFLLQLVREGLIIASDLPSPPPRDFFYSPAKGLTKELIKSVRQEILVNSQSPTYEEEPHDCDEEENTSLPSTLDLTLKVLQELTQRVISLEAKFGELENRLEGSIQSSSSISPEELLHLLRRSKQSGER